MDINTYTKISTDTTHTIKITEDDLYIFIVDRVKSIIGLHDDPETLDIFIDIPGGGDWSNQKLYIDKYHPLMIEIKTSEVKEKEEG